VSVDQEKRGVVITMSLNPDRSLATELEIPLLRIYQPDAVRFLIDHVLGQSELEDEDRPVTMQHAVTDAVNLAMCFAHTNYEDFQKFIDGD